MKRAVGFFWMIVAFLVYFQVFLLPKLIQKAGGG